MPGCKVERTPRTACPATLARSDDTTEPALIRIPQAAAQPLESDRPVHPYHRSASILDLPPRALTQAARTPARRPRVTGVDAAAGRIDAIVREITGAFRLTGGPVDSRLAPSLFACAGRTAGGHRGVRTPRPGNRPAALRGSAGKDCAEPGEGLRIDRFTRLVRAPAVRSPGCRRSSDPT